MLWSEKTYGLVGENLWFGWRKPMVWLEKTYGLQHDG